MRKLAIVSFSFSFAIIMMQYVLNINSTPLLLIWIAVLAPLCILLKNDVRLAALLVLAGLFAGVAWNAFYYNLFFMPLEKLEGQTQTVRAIVVNYPKQLDYGISLPIKVLLDDSPNVRATLYIYDSAENQKFEPGEIIEVTASFRRADYDPEITSLLAKGEFLILRATDAAEVIGKDKFSFLYLPAKFSHTVSGKIDAVFPSDTAPFVKALLLGNTDSFRENLETVSAFSICGVSHIVAVSGMHVAFLVGFLNLLFGKRKSSIISIPVLLFFMALTGFTPSVSRAGIMGIVVVISQLCARENDNITTLSLSLIILLLINPYAVKSISLQLSYASVLGIYLFGNTFNSVLKSRLANRGLFKTKHLSGLLNFISGSLSVTLSASFFSYPLIAMYFGQISIISPIVNLLILSVVSIVFSASLIICASAFLFQPIAIIFAWIVSWAIRYILSVPSLFSKLPFMTLSMDMIYTHIWMLFIYLLAFLTLFCIRKNQSLRAPVISAAASLVFVIIASYFSNLSSQEITVLDVGQGQSIVLSSNGRHAIIDCGGNNYLNAGDIAANYVMRTGKNEIEFLALTHFDDDHINGVIELMHRLKIYRLILPENFKEDDGEDIIEMASLKNIDIMYINEPTVLTMGELNVMCYPPLNNSDSNESGICYLCSSNDLDMLITGDMDTKTEEMLLNKYDLPLIEILIAGHHGSKSSTSELLLDTIKPQTVIASVGENSYNHLSQDFLRRVVSRGLYLYRTDEQGNITIKFK